MVHRQRRPVFWHPVSQLRDAREADPATELAEQKSREGTKDDPAEPAEDVAVLRRLRLHDVHGLCGDLIVLIFGHDWSLL